MQFIMYNIDDGDLISRLNFQTESDANISTAEARISDAYVAQEYVGSLKKDTTNPCSAVCDVDTNSNALCISKRTSVHLEATNEPDLLTFEIPLSSSSAVDIGFHMVRERGQDCGVFVKKAKFKVCYNFQQTSDISFICLVSYVTDCWIASMCCVEM